MLRTIFRGRNLSRLLVAFASAGAIVAVPTAASAHHTDNPYGYNDICPGYELLEGRTLRIKIGPNVTIGRVQIGVNYGNGRVCVATIKNDRVAGHSTLMDARLSPTL